MDNLFFGFRPKKQGAVPQPWWWDGHLGPGLAAFLRSGRATGRPQRNPTAAFAQETPKNGADRLNLAAFGLARPFLRDEGCPRHRIFGGVLHK